MSFQKQLPFGYSTYSMYVALSPPHSSASYSVLVWFSGYRMERMSFSIFGGERIPTVIHSYVYSVMLMETKDRTQSRTIVPLIPTTKQNTSFVCSKVVVTFMFLFA